MSPDDHDHREHSDHPQEHHVPADGAVSVPEIEEDESIAPRPEEEIADRLRAEPDVEDHSGHQA
jgi:hypothetical protein